MRYIYLKNRFIPEDQAAISVDDRSFRFGDGIFETILVTNGKMYDFPAHLERLKNGLRAFDLAIDADALESLCHELMTRNALDEGYVRIIVSRGVNGPGAIGYLPGDEEPYPVLQVIEKPFPSFQSLRLWVSSCRVHYCLPCKVNSALHYVLAMREARKENCDNALLLDAQGHACETASGNLFWFHGDTLYTPEASLPLVPGTVRRRVLDLWPGKKREGRFALEMLHEAEEIFMTNIGGLVTAISSIEPIGVARSKTNKTRNVRTLIEDDIRRRTAI